MASLGPCHPITLTFCSPRHSPLLPALAQGKRGLFPVITWGLVLFQQPAWGSSFGALLEDWGSTLAHTRKERTALPIRGSARTSGLPMQLPGAASTKHPHPRLSDPHRGATPLRSQLHCCAGQGTCGNLPAHPGSCPVPSTGGLVQRTKARRPLQDRKAESNGFQSL